jgi:hypothetical protein
MAMTRTQKSVLTGAAIVAGVAIIYAIGEGTASAAELEEEEEEEEVPELPPVIIGEVVEPPFVGPPEPPDEPTQGGLTVFDPAGLFVASEFDCDRSGNAFNLAEFPSQLPEGPQRLAVAFQDLGFAVSEQDILRADKVRAINRRIWNAPGVTPKRAETIKFAQTVFRGRAVPGHIGAGAGAVDGIPGECTIESVSAALVRKNEGNWPPP